MTTSAQPILSAGVQLHQERHVCALGKIEALLRDATHPQPDG